MKTRTIGKTGIEVSAFGMGCWQLGNVEDWGKPMSDKEGVDLVHAALDKGCNFFDTAPPYARGNSETVLGKALAGRRDQAVICTKFGYTHEYTADFSVEGLHKSLQGTLDRLQTDYVDILLVHSPGDEFYIDDMPQFKALELLKEQGKVRSFGISADTPGHLNHILNNTHSEVFEVPYSLFNQDVEEVLNKAQGQGAGFIAKIPLDSGWLSGKYTQNTEFDGARARWDADQKALRLRLIDELKSMMGETPLLELALQFSVSHPAIAATIPGTKNLSQLDSSIKALSHDLSPEWRDRLKTFWLERVKDAGLTW